MKRAYDADYGAGCSHWASALNSAADDAAGLAISSRMTSQIKRSQYGCFANAKRLLFSMVPGPKKGAMIEVDQYACRRMRETFSGRHLLVRSLLLTETALNTEIFRHWQRKIQQVGDDNKPGMETLILDGAGRLLESKSFQVGAKRFTSYRTYIRSNRIWKVKLGTKTLPASQNCCGPTSGFRSHLNYDAVVF